MSCIFHVRVFVKFSLRHCENVVELQGNKEEADDRIILNAMLALQRHTSIKVVLRLISGDTGGIDFSLLPTCRNVLRLHSRRSNAIAFKWSNAGIAQVEEADMCPLGWNVKKRRNFVWVDDYILLMKRISVFLNMSQFHCNCL